ncbi:MAG: hypothetical protein ACJA09_000845 [Alcanivorax sp.]
MLDASSYLTAMNLYCGAACAAILLLLWWLRRSWRPAWLAFAALVAAALLLTPAFPQEGVSTLAPALIVAAFQILTHGPEAAEHAVRPLTFMLGLAVVVALLLRFTVFRSRGSKQPVSPVTGKSEPH